MRRFQLLVGSQQKTFDLSDFHCRFEITQSDTFSPNGMVARIYNLDDSTINAIWGSNGARSEYTQVAIQAGYVDGPYGLIFNGTVKQLGRGRENSVDTYLEIFASEFDVPYTFDVVNQTLEGPLSPQAQLQATAAATGQTVDSDTSITGGTLPRGKVQFGMSHRYFRDLGQTTGTIITMVGGKLTVIPLTGYLPAEVVVLNSQTGLVGIPETTQNGVMAVCLLNPKVRIGSRIQIDNKTLNQSVVTDPSAFGGQQFPLIATVAADGIYRVAVVEYEGDTRGAAWYSRVTALSVDPSSAPAVSVPRYP